jgi:hypothetical protein
LEPDPEDLNIREAFHRKVVWAALDVGPRAQRVPDKRQDITLTFPFIVARSMYRTWVNKLHASELISRKGEAISGRAIFVNN